MNFTHVHGIVLHQVNFHCNRPNGPTFAITEYKRLDKVFMAKQCL